MLSHIIVLGIFALTEVQVFTLHTHDWSTFFNTEDLGKKYSGKRIRQLWFQDRRCLIVFFFVCFYISCNKKEVSNLLKYALHADYNINIKKSWLSINIQIIIASKMLTFQNILCYNFQKSVHVFHNLVLMVDSVFLFLALVVTLHVSVMVASLGTLVKLVS